MRNYNLAEKIGDFPCVNYPKTDPIDILQTRLIIFEKFLGENCR